MFNFNYIAPELLKGDAEEKKAAREEATRKLICGPVAFEIKKSLEHDKSGNPYLTKDGRPKVILIIELEDSAGNKADIFMHITEKMAFRIHDICKAIGKEHLYSKHGFDTQKIVGEKGRCNVVGEMGSYGYQLDITEFFEPNTINAKILGAVANQNFDTAFADDDIPF